MAPMKKEQKELLQHPPYQEFASSPFEEVEHILDPQNSLPNKPRSRGGAKITFPMGLHALLESLPSSETAITWQPHGRAFKVNDRGKFENEILPSFGFHYMCQYASFQRQLNIYSFMRIRRGPDTGAYYHCLFLRSRPDLCTLMRRKASKKNGVRQMIDANTEPDLSKFPPMEESFAIATNNDFMASIATTAPVFSSSGRVYSSDSHFPSEATRPSITTAIATREDNAQSRSGHSKTAPISAFKGVHLPIKVQDVLSLNSSDEPKTSAANQGTLIFSANAADTASHLTSSFPGAFSLEAPNSYLLPPLDIGANISSMTDTAEEDSSHAQYLLDIDLEYCPSYYKGYESGS